MLPERGRCRACGARLLWVRTRGGKRMPLDENPDASGNVIVSKSGQVSVYKTAQEAYKAYPDLHRFRPHHATCAQADAFRGGR